MRIFLLLVLVVLSSPAAGQHVVLLRHAEKADDGTSDPPLTAYGQARAEALIGVLQASGLTAAVTSGFKRTVQTVAPAVSHFGAREDTVGVRGGLDAHVQATAEAVRAFGPDDVVLVAGHSNTIPRIIHALGGPESPDLSEAEYDLLYFMTLGQEPELRRIYWRPVD